MFKNVVVGVDEHEGGRDAIALARLLVSEGGELTLGYVYHGDTYVWRGSSPPYEAAQRERARELLDKARDDAGIEANVRWTGSSSAGRGLHELAEEIGADLLVLGSSRHGMLGRVLVGDDTRAALNGAPCAAAIAPAGFADHPTSMREIGVGYDASPESKHALGLARKLAAEQHTKLSAFEAVFVPARHYAGPAWPDATAIEEMVDAARERIADLDGVEPHAAYGDPVEELALYSASLDLLVVGSRSYGPIGRLVHGSTSLHLARAARCPLLVLTRAARVTDAPDTSKEDQNEDQNAAVVANT